MTRSLTFFANLVIGTAATLALPVGASAQLCGGSLSSLCFSPEPMTRSAPEEALPRTTPEVPLPRTAPETPLSRNAPEEPPQDEVAAVTPNPAETPNPKVRSTRAASVRRSDLSESTKANRSVEAPSTCLSLKQVHGGYPRYRVIGGRHCWYASTRFRQETRVQIKRESPEATVVTTSSGSQTTGLEAFLCKVLNKCQ